MATPKEKFWPFKAFDSFKACVGIFILFTTVFFFLKAKGIWGEGISDNWALLGILLLSVLPVIFALIDVFIEKGGSIEYKGIKLDFSQSIQGGFRGFKIPGNIGISGAPISDSSTTEILEAIQRATTCDLIIIDLEDGKAWWETRLLVLLTGAIRHQKPAKVVFVGTDGTKEDIFQGWAHPSDLLPLLLKSNKQYEMLYSKTVAAVQQWALIEPAGPNFQHVPLPFMQTTATKHPWMAFTYESGLPNPFFGEQLLASLLGEEIESKESPKEISLARAEELFRSVLRKQAIDESWGIKQQNTEFFETDEDYLAITHKRKFKALVSRLALLSEALKSMNT